MKKLLIVLFLLSATVLFVGAGMAQAQQEEQGQQGQTPFIFGDGFETGDIRRWQNEQPEVIATLVSTSATLLSPTRVEYQIELDVRNTTSSNLFFEKTFGTGQPSPANGTWSVVRNAAGAVHSGGARSYALGAACPCAQDTPTHFALSAGTTRKFILYMIFDNTGGIAGSYRLQLTGFSYDRDGNDDNGDDLLLIQYGAGFETELRYIGNNAGEPLMESDADFTFIDRRGQEWSFITSGVLK